MSTIQNENRKDMTSKEILLARLSCARSNYLLSFAAVFLLFNPKTNALLRSGEFYYNGVALKFLDFDHIGKEVADDKKKKAIFDNFLMVQIMTIAKEPFELIKAYCEETCDCAKRCEETCNNKQKFKSLDFYYFGRILRNCVSHDRKVEFNKYYKNKNIVSVYWRDKEITEDMDGKGLPISLFDYEDALNLFDDYYDFAETGLD